MKKSIKNFGTKKDKDENKFYSLFETSINGVILGKPDGTILEANNAVIDIFGYSLSKIKKLGRQGLFEMNDSNMSKADAIRTTKGKAQGILIGIRKNGGADLA